MLTQHDIKSLCKLPKDRYAKVGATGLINMGNTCYANSVLQMLLHSPLLRDFLLLGLGGRENQTEQPTGAAKKETENPIGKTDENGEQTTGNSEKPDEKGNKSPQTQEPTLSSLRRIFADFWSGAFSAIRPEAVVRAVQDEIPAFVAWKQHDAHEFLTRLLELLHEETLCITPDAAEAPPAAQKDQTDKGAERLQILKTFRAGLEETGSRRLCAVLNDQTGQMDQTSKNWENENRTAELLKAEVERQIAEISGKTASKYGENDEKSDKNDEKIDKTDEKIDKNGENDGKIGENDEKFDKNGKKLEKTKPKEPKLSPTHLNAFEAVVNSLVAHRAARPMAAAKQSLVKDLFFGTLLSEVRCSECGRLSTAQSLFSSLALELPPAAAQPQPLAGYLKGLFGLGQKPRAELWDCLRRYFGGENSANTPVQNENGSVQTPVQKENSSVITPVQKEKVSVQNKQRGPKYELHFCGFCERKVAAQKTLRLRRAPELLCLQINRFARGSKRKIEVPLDFPLDRLDLSEFCAEPLIKAPTAADNAADTCDDQSFTNGGSAVSAIGNGRAKNENGAEYSLRAAVVHNGSVNSGHYVAYCRHPEGGEWREFNDRFTAPITVEQLRQKPVLILLYERVQSGCVIDRNIALVQSVLKNTTTADNTDPFGPPSNAAPLLLSRQWLTKLALLDRPGPLENRALQCRHGAPLFTARQKRDEKGDEAPPQTVGRALAVTESQWAALAEAFGEEPGSRTTRSDYSIDEGAGEEDDGETDCALCERDALRYRKRTERRAVEAMEESFRLQKSSVTYVVSEEWMSAWRGFVTGEEGYPPGAISNAHLLDESGGVKLDLKIEKDFRVLSKEVWEFLHKIYGGGPVVYNNFLDERELIGSEDENECDSH